MKPNGTKPRKRNLPPNPQKPIKVLRCVQLKQSSFYTNIIRGRVIISFFSFYGEKQTNNKKMGLVPREFLSLQRGLFRDILLKKGELIIEGMESKDSSKWESSPFCFYRRAINTFAQIIEV
ncbi:hypothetical protein CEXT_278641 [Caerostris extrusa]|uniref:Uncharacterized protein n=1 Tax=Caerostris extrusa TaxID=172846 RepID=A0AAV4SPR0_CAEEX|nr:hypothetical protein CEXT_278641 [Caerostris extrusa]